MDDLEQKLGAPLFILPSSVHELIAIPDKGISDVNELRNMVREVNETQVEAEEILSNQVYRYSKGKYAIAV